MAIVAKGQNLIYFSRLSSEAIIYGSVMPIAKEAAKGYLRGSQVSVVCGLAFVVLMIVYKIEKMQDETYIGTYTMSQDIPAYSG